MARTGKGRVMNRWLVVAGAIAIQVCLGVIYAWSVFTPSLVKAKWSVTETQIVFSVGLAVFAVVMVLAGRIMPRFGPRPVAIAGGLVLGLGYVLAGLFGGTSFNMILVTIGIVGGAGIGLGYVVPIAVGMRWFPDKKGLITGLAVAGFGFGGLLWVKLADTWGHLIEAYGLSNTFSIYGVIFAALVVIGGLFMVNPPEGWQPEGWRSGKRGGAAAARAAEFSSSAMLATPSST